MLKQRRKDRDASAEQRPRLSKIKRIRQRTGPCPLDPQTVGKSTMAAHHGALTARTPIVVAREALVTEEATMGEPADANALADLKTLSILTKGNHRADCFMARHERKCGPAPFVIEHGEVGMTDSAVTDLNLYFLGPEFPRIEAERFKRGMRCGSSVSMEGGGHLVRSPKT